MNCRPNCHDLPFVHPERWPVEERVQNDLEARPNESSMGTSTRSTDCGQSRGCMRAREGRKEKGRKETGTENERDGDKIARLV